MPNILNVERQVPLMFRAQVERRSQLQRLDPKRNQQQEPQDAEIWVDQWVERVDQTGPQFGDGVETRTYQVNWRFVTNGGQDDGIIRPVIGAGGWPFYPGSSMKGLFRSACTREQAERYCGRPLPGNDFAPGLLRFHGAYPTDEHWTERLLDLVHPQQKRQVGLDDRASSAFAMVSLYRPELRFGISSSKPLAADEWDTIWSIWEKALGKGIGSRVCAGYGQVQGIEGDRLWKGKLRGEGQAAKLLDGSGEFRPNSFRAAIRGHALRIFGGLTDADSAQRAVNELFGSVEGRGDVGLLAMAFTPTRDVVIGSFGAGRWKQPTYEVTGEFEWLLTQPLEEESRKTIKLLITRLTRFALLLGGIGKSWRRADHRLFFEDYYGDGRSNKPLIGCHWQWQETSIRSDAIVRAPGHVERFIGSVRESAQEWLQRRKLLKGTPAQWREAWNPSKVQVWGRIARDERDSLVVDWLHGNYATGKAIYKTSVAGQLGKIGRIWHRMYPLTKLRPDPNNADEKVAVLTPSYLELLTIFPDSSRECQDFLQFLRSQAPNDTRDNSALSKLWGG
ncbi:hypothetical protein VZG28_06400 [Synechococcus elongatus IITB4]|uniref:hypothetical protein n=1 Tax=Synechococcus elongatus TaxID=32046 RepID=UPI0030D31818